MYSSLKDSVKVAAKFVLAPMLPAVFYEQKEKKRTLLLVEYSAIVGCCYSQLVDGYEEQKTPEYSNVTLLTVTPTLLTASGFHPVVLDLRSSGRPLSLLQTNLI